jgi:hypothetical protein
MLSSIWIGRILGGIALLFLLVDAVTHIIKIQPVVEAFEKLSIPVSLSIPLGIVVLACLALCVFYPTRILGAVLLTGYLGGAVAIHLRAGSTPFEIIFPILIGALLWGGLFLSDERVRSLTPCNPTGKHFNL